MRSSLTLLVAALSLHCTKAPTPDAEHAKAIMTPPIASKHPYSTTLHGDTRVDDYHWLRDKGADGVTAYLEAENAYTAAYMRPTEALQRTLYREIVGRIQETDQSAPYRKGAFEYYHRTEEGKQYRIFCRREPGRPSTETVLLDMNELAEHKPFLGLGVFEVSPDGRYLAFSLDETGFREYTLQIKDLETGALLPERIEKVKSLAWAGDSRTFFYTVDDATKRPYRVLRHELGREGDDPLLYQEDDERFRVATWSSRSGDYVVRGSFSHTTSEVAFLEADDPTSAWKTVAPRETGHEYDVAHQGRSFLIRTNDLGPNFRIVRASIEDPDRSSWKEVVSHREDVMIEQLDAFERFFVVLEREQGVPRLSVHTGEGEVHAVPVEEEVYALYPGANEEYATDRFRFRYESLTTPESAYDYEVDRRHKSLVKRVEVLGDYLPEAYRSERLWATAADGTKVPISLVFREGTPRDGTAPLLLAGYGSYGYPYPTGFSHARVSLLDRGVIYAIAHVRGGGELGKPWHDDGRMRHKQNTFTDFVAVAEHLIEQGYTTKDRLAIMGGSAGGLLMGVVVNSRPELFAAVVSLVPFVDVLNTMLDDTLPLTVGEYEEWGNPNEREAYLRIKDYCPYTNVQAHEYPAMLVRTSLNDSQVMYWEPSKYVAKLRATKTDDNPLLFRINMEAGHGGASGRYDYLEETAFDYAFLLTELGVVDPRSTR